MPRIVVNTTPLISLCYLDKLDLLKLLYENVSIAQAVYDEIAAKPDSIANVQINAAQKWINVVKIKNEMAKVFYKSQLHDGEVETMILSKELNADLLIIDDKNAKKHAKYLGLNVTGTLGVLLKAKKLGYITSIQPLIDKLLTKNIYIGNSIIQFCLKEAGELN
jgi:predicted nucleic acid-binding protein